MKRIEALKGLDVAVLVFRGRTEVAGLRVLGKGHVGVVIACEWKGRSAALKIRRTDADRESLEREAGILSEANKWGLGPQLYAFSRDFIVMEELVGERLVDWLAGSSAIEDREFRRVLSNVCDQARLLDEAGIDHKELSDPRRHVIVQSDGRARLLDFETAGVGGMKRNVNSLIQFLTLSGPYGRAILTRLGGDREAVLAALRAYRRRPAEGEYRAVRESMGLS